MAAYYFVTTVSMRGVQGTKRKRRFPFMTLDMWTGTTTLVKKELVTIASKAKWGRTKSLIEVLWDMVVDIMATTDQSYNAAKLI